MKNMEIPDELVFEILKHMNYDEISKLRLINQRFNTLCGTALNVGFNNVKVFHKQCLKDIKEALPRRDSERRKHHLYPRHDVLHAIETRLSLLSMTYMKYMADRTTCFIPGKVLDELYKILKVIKCRDTPLISTMTMTLLQEMRDISSMAMEHFDEVIIPGLSKSQPHAALQWFEHADPGISADSSRDSDTSCGNPANLKKELDSINKTIRNLTRKRQQDKKTINELKLTVSKQSRKIQSFDSKTEVLTNANSSLMQTLQEMKGQVSEMAKQLNTLQGFLEVTSDFSTKNSLIPGTSGKLCINTSQMLDENSNIVRSRTVKKRTHSDQSQDDSFNLNKRSR